MILSIVSQFHRKCIQKCTLSCANSHHEVTNSEVYGMVSNTKKEDKWL